MTKELHEEWLIRDIKLLERAKTEFATLQATNSDAAEAIAQREDMIRVLQWRVDVGRQTLANYESGHQ